METGVLLSEAAALSPSFVADALSLLFADSLAGAAFSPFPFEHPATIIANNKTDANTTNKDFFNFDLSFTDSGV